LSDDHKFSFVLAIVKGSNLKQKFGNPQQTIANVNNNNNNNNMIISSKTASEYSVKPPISR
jgi:hypothetical protein